jgi:hypothetical protein
MTPTSRDIVILNWQVGLGTANFRSITVGPLYGKLARKSESGLE